MQAFQTLAFSILYHEDRYFTIRHDVTYDSRVVNSYRNNFEALIADIGKWREKNYRIIFISPSTTRAKRMDTYTFEDVLHIIADSLKEQINKENLEKLLSYNVSNEVNFIIRAVPRVFKSIAMRRIYKASLKANTSTITNMLSAFVT